MKERLISYETAKMASEKGFDEFDSNNNKVYCEMKESVFYHKPVQHDYDDIYNAHYLYRAPTQSLLQKWLREEHKIEMHNFCGGGSGCEKWYKCNMPSCYAPEHKGHVTTSDTYEDALEEGLQEALKAMK